MLSGIDLATSCIMSGEGVRMDVASKIRVLKTVYATLPCHTCGEKDVAAICYRFKRISWIKAVANDL